VKKYQGENVTYRNTELREKEKWCHWIRNLDVCPPIRFPTSGSKSPPCIFVHLSIVVCAESHDRLMFFRSSLKVFYVFLDLPRLLLLDVIQFIACLVNLCSCNLNIMAAKRTRRSVTISCIRNDELLYRTLDT